MIAHSTEGQICTVYFISIPALELEAVTELEKYMKPLGDDPKIQSILLDFSDVQHIDSTGIGLVFYLHKRFNLQRNKDTTSTDSLNFALFGLGQEMKELFKVLGLDTVLSIFVDESAARVHIGGGI